MLEHFFWLLEFKFQFEFYLLNPFQTQTLIPKTPKIPNLNPISKPLPSSPTQQQACAAACSSPRSGPAARQPA
jgi:hypothetical protein